MTDRSELADAVRKWLAVQGYPLEMRVSQYLIRSGFDTTQSDSYTDADTSEPREIDVFAVLAHKIGHLTVRVSLCVECKTSRDKPWVLFTTTQPSVSGRRILAQAASQAAREFVGGLDHDIALELGNSFGFPNRYAYALRQVLGKPNDRDAAYAACMVAAKSSQHKADLSNGLLSPPSCDFVFPVVVFDGALFECFLDDDGKPILEEVSEGLVIWRQPVADGRLSAIRVCNEASLPKVIGNMKAVAKLIFKDERRILALAKKQFFNFVPWQENNPSERDISGIAPSDEG